MNLFVLFLSTFFFPSRRQNQRYQLNPTTRVESFQVKRHSWRNLLLRKRVYEQCLFLLSVTLEVAWGPHSGQQKVLQRVEGLKNERAQSKSRSDTREQLENKSCQPQVKCKAKGDARPKAGPAERSQTAVNSGLSLRKPPLTEAPGI